MINKKIFTIIICCYNSGERIKRVINNIVNQEYFDDLVDKVLIVNNNSTDNTHDYAKECCCISNKIIEIFEGEQGLSNARRTGVNNTRSEWIIFIDDDNFMDDNWIYNASKYIEQNKKVGAFNGVVIPRVPVDIDKEYMKRLEVSLKPLACTHFKREEITVNCKNPFRVPIGAGLVIKSEPLKNLVSKGWLNSLGRKGKELTSGEDGEMTLYVKKMGYEFGFSTNMILEHEISIERLDKSYLERLWFEVGKGVAGVINNEKVSNIKSIVYSFILRIRLLKKYINKGNRYYYQYYKIFIKGYEHGDRR